MPVRPEHDPALDEFPPCAVCGVDPYDCACPPSPVCFTNGDPACAINGGLECQPLVGTPPHERGAS